MNYSVVTVRGKQLNMNVFILKLKFVIRVNGHEEEMYHCSEWAEFVCLFQLKNTFSSFSFDSSLVFWKFF